MARSCETEDSINAWAEGVFGPAPKITALTKRMREELDELDTALAEGDPAAIRLEVADAAILLMRVLALTGGGTLQSAVDDKMAINRTRQWQPAGDGTGRHKP